MSQTTNDLQLSTRNQLPTTKAFIMKNYSFLSLFLLSSYFLSAQVTADFEFFPMTACAPSAIDFSDLSSSTSGNIVSWEWDLGGVSSNMSAPSRVFSTGGTYEICLTVTDDQGGMDTKCDELIIYEIPVTNLEVNICEGDSYSIGGEVINETGSYTITLFESSFNGCDSIVNLNLLVEQIVPVFFSAEFCDGGSFVINGNVYDASNPSGTEVFANGSFNGCDSVVFIDLVFFPLIETNLDFTFCDGESIVVNWTTYDADNPTGVETLISENGCDSIINVNLITGLQVTGQVTNIFCEGGSGSIDISIANGDGSYTYNWSGPNLIVSDVEDLSDITEPGLYQLEVSDASGCSAVETFIITDNALITIEANVIQPSCNFLLDGSITVTASGGAGTYTYLWEPNLNTSQSIVGIGSGEYTIVVTDNNGCTITETYVLDETAPLTLNITAPELACENEANILVEPIGGTPGYTYTWSNGANTPTLENVIAGTYTVEVFDSNGCMATETIFIASPLDLEATSTFADCDLNNATATAVLNGVSDADFLWSNGGNTATQSDLAPGWYSVTATDATTNCQVHQNVEVLEDTICYVVISGYVFANEFNDNCEIDANSVTVKNVMIELSDGQTTFTNCDGFYEFTTEAGNQTLSLNLNQANYDPLCTDDILVNASTWGETYPDNNFFLKYSEGRDLELKISKQNARPGFTQYVRVCMMNRGAVPVTGNLTFIHPDIQEFEYSNPTETDYDEGTKTLNWEFENIPPGVVYVYTTYLKTPIGTDLGTELEYYFEAEPVEGDLTPENNEEICTIEVTGSYDPNDKQVTPIGQGPQGAIEMSDSLLSYQVRFQNTGTDTAFTVLIRDTLDSDLALRSVVPGPSSHIYAATIKEGNVLELLFENILLPDSFINEPASNGFVFFDIKIKPNSPYGTRIENRAAIFFDFNPPIITNTVLNTIEMITGSQTTPFDQILMTLNPNPVGINSLLSYSLTENSDVSIQVFDLNGRLQKVLVDNEYQAAGLYELFIQNNDLPKGVYTLQIKTNHGRAGILKFVQL